MVANVYPNEGNYVLPSFMSPQIPPDADPDSEPLVHADFSAAWLPVLEGALDQLIQYGSWNTDDAGKLLAVNRAATLKELIATDALGTIDTPYWDDSEDVDDELPIEEQPWYGTVTDPEAPADELDFVENAAVFALTGFLAIATWEVAAAPAILFHTIAPRFIIAMKRGDVGEIIRILVDGEEAARVDTTPYAEGDVIQQAIVAPDSETGHDLIVVQVS
jgi:hypothetical protein